MPQKPSSSTSMPGVFPAVGTLFESMTAFRLAVYRACLTHNVELKIKHGGSTAGDMSCRLSTGTTLSTFSAGAPCTFAVYVGRAGDGGGGVDVRRVCEEHSCVAGVRKLRRGEARSWTERKIEELETGKALRTRRRRAVAAEASADEDSEAAAEEDENDDGSSSESSADELYPPVEKLKSGIVQIMQNGPVSFPSPSATFLSAVSLLTTLNAYAHSRNFTLIRRSPATNESHLKLICYRGHWRYRNAAGGRCPVFFEAKRGDDGRWSVTGCDRAHNHSLELGSVERDKLGMRSALRKLPSQKRQRIVDDEEADTPAPQPVASGSGLAARGVLAGAPSSLLLSTADLGAFVQAHFVPIASETLVALVVFLEALEIRSTADLVALLLLEEGTLALLLERVMIVSGAEAAHALEEVVRAVRAGAWGGRGCSELGRRKERLAFAISA